jgi:hypothetical protein
MKGAKVANKDVDDLIDEIRRWKGWRVVPTRKGWIVYPPDRTQPGIAIHKTPSDKRAMKNAIARLRRAGGPI